MEVNPLVAKADEPPDINTHFRGDVVTCFFTVEFAKIRQG